jgi:hypothetical protein
MNILEKIRVGAHGLARFMQLQLFLTLFSLPIVLAWGLPVSLLSPLGNLIFGPALTIFLFLSSLIFFGQLVCIPVAPLIWLLEKSTSLWLTFMHADLQTWLVGCSAPPLFCMVLMGIVPFFIMIHTKIGRHLYVNLGALTALLAVITLYLKCAAIPHTRIVEIPCNKGNITFIKTAHTHILIDPGYLGQRINALSFAQYTLIPTILKSSGSTTIDHLIILQPNTMTFQAIECLCTKMKVKTIYLVMWRGNAKKSFMRSYFRCITTAKKLGVRIVRITDHDAMTIGTQCTPNIVIQPTGTTIKTAAISYPALSVRTQIDNQEITLYSAKYANKQQKAHPSNKNDNHI